MSSINREWFVDQLKKKRMNQSDIARALGLDKSAVSRLLSGKRGLNAHEQDKIAHILGISVEEFAALRTGDQGGFAERGQAPFDTGSGVKRGRLAVVVKDTDDDQDLPDHPIWGSMAGTITVMPGVDLTAPMEFEWGQTLYNE
ncbi:helix-turn-helix transcriptional regulator [Rhizobium sp. RU36D]|uniref:helix-turn-helix domain-containing protein n=1 Tax=Rhizobium sp. RU36D TaxID=1907415 RepID=UPI0009D90857|nr:helix-turn-helix transcriptional regulator [Rhizobium sp. RU36D]SMC60120.1 Helix-turn-helix domain-containing protein [Rhizobium sp. RU36D]